MKRILNTLLGLFLAIEIYAQAPISFNYQAIVRSSTGEPITTQTVSFRFSIIKSIVEGSIIYEEKHIITTNQFGLVNLAIGSGTNKVGSLSNIDWGSDNYFLKIEIDITGGNSYTDMGTTQLLSVPYALYANKAEELVIPGQAAGDILYYNGSEWVTLPKGSYGQVLMMNSSGQPFWFDLAGVPVVASLSVSNISISGATLNGVVDANALTTEVTFEYGTTTSYGNSITAVQSPIFGSTNINVSANISSLELLTTYHFRLKAVNALGTTFSEDFSFPYVYLGASFGGGKIFYIDESGIHGLIATLSNQSNSVVWGCSYICIDGADGTAVGTGFQNTIDIENGCTTSGIAADICANLIQGGFSDWFLPSKDELNLLYNNRAYVGGFISPNLLFWSSSEEYNGGNCNTANYQSFANGTQSTNDRNSALCVRAIRIF